MADNEAPRVTFTFAPEKLTLQSQGATSGRSKVEVPLEYDSKKVEINFNPAYLIEMLKVLPPDADLIIELNDGESPALLRCGDTCDFSNSAISRNSSSCRLLNCLGVSTTTCTNRSPGDPPRLG